MPPTVFTIGHSTHSSEAFIDLLKGAGIEVVADVRSSPYSRFHEHFNREDLRVSLAESRIRYVYIGDTLGGRPDLPSLFTDGVADYEKMAATPDFAVGLSRLVKGVSQYRVALMCSERDPLDCHRFLLVARALRDRGKGEIVNILHDGRHESIQETERRLVLSTGQAQTSLFAPAPTDPVAEAYRSQATQIAYREAEPDLDSTADNTQGERV